MTEELEGILVKIQKLLALGTSSNPNEANVAIAKANELLVKHNLSLLDVDTHKRAKQYTEAEFDYTFAIEEKYIRDILSRFFYVKAILIPYKHKWAIMGTTENVAVASYMRDHISHKFNGAWHNYKKANNVKGIAGKTDFYRGLNSGLKEKLESERSRLVKEYGMIVLDKDPELEKNFNDKFKPQPHRGTLGRLTGDGQARNAGHSAGKNLSLNQGVRGGSAAPLRLN